jgi:predicted ABC-type sugar transport system permease subunit
MSLLNYLRHKPPGLTTASKYTALNGIGYLVVGATLIVWPEVTQTLFREPAFVGHEQALMRVIGLTVVVIGWL